MSAPKKSSLTQLLAPALLARDGPALEQLMRDPHLRTLARQRLRALRYPPNAHETQLINDAFFRLLQRCEKLTEDKLGDLAGTDGFHLFMSKAIRYAMLDHLRGGRWATDPDAVPGILLEALEVEEELVARCLAPVPGDARPPHQPYRELVEQLTADHHVYHDLIEIDAYPPEVCRVLVDALTEAETAPLLTAVPETVADRIAFLRDLLTGTQDGSPRGVLTKKLRRQLATPRPDPVSDGELGGRDGGGGLDAVRAAKPGDDGGRLTQNTILTLNECLDQMDARFADTDPAKVIVSGVARVLPGAAAPIALYRSLPAQVFGLRFFCRCTLQEVADLLAVSTATVHRKYRIACEDLRQALQSSYADLQVDDTGATP